MSSSRPRSRWTPPPPPTPKILNLPRRSRRKVTKQQPNKQHLNKLESLFDQERVFSRTVPIVLLNSPRRERVENLNEFKDDDEADSEEEKWRFQAEILRAECNYLRMERDIALKKLELSRVQTKRTLKSAVETLVSGKEKIHDDDRLQQEIQHLEEKLIQLQRNSSVKDFEIQHCSNFDKEASVLQKKLQKLGEEEEEDSRLTVKIDNRENRFKDVECLRRKMERLSRGMLEKMEEEYGWMLLSSSSSTSTTTTTASASGTSSASSSRRIEFPNLSSSLQVQSLVHFKERKSEEKRCSGKCKRIVRKIVEQVRAEMEQWTMMQDMLESVKQEMEELQSSRDFWHDRALDSEDQLQSLLCSEQEWKQKAAFCESKLGEVEKHVKELHLELGRLKSKQKKESENVQKEKEKRVLICRLKENSQRGGTGDSNKNKFCNDIQQQKQKSCGNALAKRSPLCDIQNFHSSPLWENNRGVHFPMP